MSRKIFLVAFGIVFALLTTTFYGQQQAQKVEQVQQNNPAIPTSDPPVVDGDDPLLKEMTDLFLNDKGSNRKLEFPEDGQTKTEGKSSAVYHAAELLLKAARILEADIAKSGSENFQGTQRVTQLRAIAVEMLAQ